MSAHTSKYPQPPFTRAIALSGDRAGSQGTFQFAGLAWIYDTKVTLVQGGAQSLKTPADWRQLLRLIRLAYRLRKPIILWDLPVIHIATKQRKASLANAQAIQNAELALLKLPHPIITVFEETERTAHPLPEPIWNDGVVLLTPPDAQLSESGKLKITRSEKEIASAILELLRQIEALPATELIENRSTALQMCAKSKIEFPQNCHHSE